MPELNPVEALLVTWFIILAQPITWIIFGICIIIFCLRYASERTLGGEEEKSWRQRYYFDNH